MRVGDRSASGDVVFADAQWAKLNALSSGAVSPAFRGYAANGAPACGATLAARPGNAMPEAVAAYQAVAVTGDVARAGSWFTAAVERVVIVRADPGAPGRGTVVASLCG